MSSVYREWVVYFEALDALVPRVKLSDKPLRLPLKDVYKISGIGTVAVGRVETGTLKAGMAVTFSPAAITTEVKSVMVNHVNLEQAVPGDDVGFNIKDVDVRQVRSGAVCSDENDPAKEAESFIAHVIITNYSGEIKKGFTPIIHCHTAVFACVFNQLIEKIDGVTGVTLVDNPTSIKPGDAAIIEMIPSSPVCVEAFDDYPALGRFLVKDGKSETIAVGVIKSVKKKI